MFFSLICITNFQTCREKLSVLSRIDNQIVTLSARSPESALSGCTIVPKGPTRPFAHLTTTTATPIELSTPGDVDIENVTTETIFDKYLHRTTVIPKDEPDGHSSDNTTEDTLGNEFSSETMEKFNETEVFNATSGGNSRNGGGLYFKHDIGLENVLENTTEYKKDVEELFEPPKRMEHLGDDDIETIETSRHRRSNPSNYHPTRTTYIVRCHNAGSFISSRERWWFIAIANCGNGKGLDVKYRFKMTNGEPGDFWHEHFSADERRKLSILQNSECRKRSIFIIIFFFLISVVPPILLCEFISYSLLLVALFFCTVELKSLHLYHCTYRLFAFSVMIQYIGVLVLGIAWIRYGMTGLGPHTTVGSLLTGVSEIAFLLLLLLMAKGYTITRARLSSCSIVKLTIFINTYIVAYIILFIYQAEAFDPGEVLNLYESVSLYL